MRVGGCGLAGVRFEGLQGFCGFRGLQVFNSSNPSSNPNNRNLALTLASSKSNPNDRNLEHGQDLKSTVPENRTTAGDLLKFVSLAWEAPMVGKVL